MSRSRKILTQSHWEDLRKDALRPRNASLPVPMGSLEEDLRRAVQGWEIKDEYLENEDGVKIDFEDLLWVRFRRVVVDVYASIGLGGSPRRLHSLICPSFGSGFTDHRNRDKLDNRRGNLRVATISESNINKPYDASKEKTSSFRGVSKWECKRGKYRYEYWRATLSFNGKHIALGVRKTEMEAARLYNEMAPKYHGEFTQLNPLP